MFRYTAFSLFTLICSQRANIPFPPCFVIECTDRASPPCKDERGNYRAEMPCGVKGVTMISNYLSVCSLSTASCWWILTVCYPRSGFAIMGCSPALLRFPPTAMNRKKLVRIKHGSVILSLTRLPSAVWVENVRNVLDVFSGIHQLHSEHQTQITTLPTLGAPSALFRDYIRQLITGGFFALSHMLLT